MAGLQLKVTTAGRTAIVNLPNTGTNAVVITHIGVTATAFTANAGMTSLPGELKRLTTFSGIAVADDTIHVTLRDDSADSYSMRGFALYLADGTLFALYGQADVILEKSTQAMLLLSADTIFADIAATSITFGDANFINPPASTTVQGVTQYATNQEALAGSAGNRSIVASALKYVLDSRFGAGAPSTFVKGLLTLTTAALLRTAIEIKSAALKDEGSGNGLDADLLDGKHAVDFATSAHAHDAASIVSGVFDVARIPSIAISKVTGLQGALDGKAAVSHTHAIADVTGLQSALDGKASTSHNHGNDYVKNESSATNDVKMRWEAGMVRLRVDATDQGGVWTSQNFAPSSKSDVGHTHATLTRGGYLTGANYNGGAATTWAVDATETATPGKIAARNASGDIIARLFRMEYTPTNANVGFFVTLIATGAGATADNYMRPTTPDQAKAALAIQQADVAGLVSALAALAPKANPTFTGTAIAPTPAAADDSTKIATTAWVRDFVTAMLAGYLTKNNPTFTGTMTGPAYNKP